MVEYCDDHKLMGQNCGRIEKLEAIIDDRVWPAIERRLKTATFIAVFVIFLGVLGGGFTLLYNQGLKSEEKIESVGKELGAKINAIESQQKVVQNNQRLLMRNSGIIRRNTD